MCFTSFCSRKRVQEWGWTIRQWYWHQGGRSKIRCKRTSRQQYFRWQRSLLPRRLERNTKRSIEPTIQINQTDEHSLAVKTPTTCGSKTASPRQSNSTQRSQPRQLRKKTHLKPSRRSQRQRNRRGKWPSARFSLLLWVHHLAPARGVVRQRRCAIGLGGWIDWWQWERGMVLYPCLLDPI